MYFKIDECQKQNKRKEKQIRKKRTSLAESNLGITTEFDAFKGDSWTKTESEPEESTELNGVVE